MLKISMLLNSGRRPTVESMSNVRRIYARAFRRLRRHFTGEYRNGVVGVPLTPDQHDSILTVPLPIWTVPHHWWQLKFKTQTLRDHPISTYTLREGATKYVRSVQNSLFFLWKMREGGRWRKSLLFYVHYFPLETHLITIFLCKMTYHASFCQCLAYFL